MMVPAWRSYLAEAAEFAELSFRATDREAVVYWRDMAERALSEAHRLKLAGC